MPSGTSLQGRTILIVQRTWLIASTLADAFEAKGAQVVMAKKADPDLANLPNLSAAVLDGQRVGLRRELQSRRIPLRFVHRPPADRRCPDYSEACVISRSRC